MLRLALKKVDRLVDGHTEVHPDSLLLIRDKKIIGVISVVGLTACKAKVSIQADPEELLLLRGVHCPGKKLGDFVSSQPSVPSSRSDFGPLTVRRRQKTED